MEAGRTPMEEKKIPTEAIRIPIKTEFIRLDAFLKFAGAAGTGGEAKMRITDGYVRVNGAVCTQRGRKLRPGDAVSYLGREYVVG